MNNSAFSPGAPPTPPRTHPAGAAAGLGGGALAALLAQLTGTAPAPAPAAVNACQCLSPPVPCDLVAGFSGAYDFSSNKLFERHLHAECRSHLYPAGQYDSADRLLQYRRGLLAPGGAALDTLASLPGSDDQRAYDLDRLGNWQSTTFTPACGTPQTQQRLHNALNQITQVTQGTTTTPFAYDGAPGKSNGNLIDDGVRLYQYDAFNRLIAVTRKRDGQVIAQYLYDALGRRVRKVVSNGGLSGDILNGTTDYLYHSQQCLEERVGGSVVRQYAWGAYIDELLQQRELGGRQAVDLYPVSDLLYRTVAVTDAGCAVVAAYDTDAYGRTLLYNGPGPDGRWFTDDDQATDNPLCPYVFTGRRYDPETGLYYYRARYYAPEWGRFLSRDPIDYAAAMGLYEYVHSNPLIVGDPTGLGFGQRVLGGLRIIGGGIGLFAGAGLAVASGVGTILSLGAASPISIPGLALGLLGVVRGADVMFAGIREVWSGEPQQTFTEKGVQWLAQKAGASRGTAATIASLADLGISLFTTLGAAWFTRSLERTSRAAQLLRSSGELVPVGPNRPLPANVEQLILKLYPEDPLYESLLRGADIGTNPFTGHILVRGRWWDTLSAGQKSRVFFEELSHQSRILRTPIFLRPFREALRLTSNAFFFEEELRASWYATKSFKEAWRYASHYQGIYMPRVYAGTAFFVYVDAYLSYRLYRNLMRIAKG